MIPPSWTDEKVERMIGNLLRTGVSLAAIVVFCGGIIFLAHHGESHTNYHIFQGEPETLTRIPAILQYASQGHGRGIIQLGLLLLIATPVAVRVCGTTRSNISHVHPAGVDHSALQPLWPVVDGVVFRFRLCRALHDLESRGRLSLR
jgi:uncharacterized membrane protein